MSKVIFISGPHGSGKTTLLEKLKEKYGFIEKEKYQIDFLKEYPSIPYMNMFERCSLRLYHRFYVGEITMEIAATEEKIFLVDRGIYDSLAYSNVEYLVNEIDDEQYELLMQMGNNCLEMLKPNTIILNPPVETIVNRLDCRRASGICHERDVLCAREDTLDYVSKLHEEFEKYKFDKNVLYITDNDNEAEKEIIKWINSLEEK